MPGRLLPHLSPLKSGLENFWPNQRLTFNAADKYLGGVTYGGYSDSIVVDEPAVFDGLTYGKKAATPLKLKSVEQRANDVLWIRYEVIRT